MKLSAYHCSSCGAPLLAPNKHGYSSCQYCGSVSEINVKESTPLLKKKTGHVSEFFIMMAVGFVGIAIGMVVWQIVKNKIS